MAQARCATPSNQIISLSPAKSRNAETKKPGMARFSKLRFTTAFVMQHMLRQGYQHFFLWAFSALFLTANFGQLGLRFNPRVHANFSSNLAVHAG